MTTYDKQFYGKTKKTAEKVIAELESAKKRIENNEEIYYQVRAFGVTFVACRAADDGYYIDFGANSLLVGSFIAGNQQLGCFDRNGESMGWFKYTA